MAVSTPNTPQTGTRPPFVVSGASVWILFCADGWEKKKIYQADPYYTDAQGVKKPKRMYLYGHFWLQPDTGNLWQYTDNPDVQHCLDEAITTLHTVYHTTVCGVIGVAEGKGEWTPADVVSYTKRVVSTPGLLQPIVDQVKAHQYDCLVNDIEDGNAKNPQIFSTYEHLLKSQLSVPLGQTLLWKTEAVSGYWQRWEDWQTLSENADFFIVMALDHDSINDQPIPSSVVNLRWVKDIYTYLRSITDMFGKHPIEWELPAYYRLFVCKEQGVCDSQQGGIWDVSSGTDVEEQIAVALQSNAVAQNYLTDPRDPYIEYTNAAGKDAYLFIETAESSDTIARAVAQLNGSGCLSLSFWDNDSGQSLTRGWKGIEGDRAVALC